MPRVFSAFQRDLDELPVWGIGMRMTLPKWKFMTVPGEANSVMWLAPSHPRYCGNTDVDVCRAEVHLLHGPLPRRFKPNPRLRDSWRE